MADIGEKEVTIIEFEPIPAEVPAPAEPAAVPAREPEPSR